jgi:uncharacterized protein (DUF924 family)
MSSQETARVGIGPEEVLSFWFPEGEITDGDLETGQRRIQWWFAGGPDVDRELEDRFGGLLEQARKGDLDHWADTVRGRLALVIVLDQFSRNVYRGTPQAYAQDPKALQLALEGIEAGIESGLTLSERSFLWLPLSHSEELAMQERFARHLEEEAANVPTEWRAYYEFLLVQARANRDVIGRFGRHPHRNEVLGRPSTPEELEWLRTETPVHLRRPPSQSS